MNVYEIIDKKKRGLELNQTEIEYLINGYVNNEIPDYQISIDQILNFCLVKLQTEIEYLIWR